MSDLTILKKLKQKPNKYTKRQKKLAKDKIKILEDFVSKNY